MTTTGFESFRIESRLDVFADAPQAGSAAAFGTIGITFTAIKPTQEQS